MELESPGNSESVLLQQRKKSLITAVMVNQSMTPVVIKQMTLNPTIPIMLMIRISQMIKPLLIRSATERPSTAGIEPLTVKTLTPMKRLMIQATAATITYSLTAPKKRFLPVI